VKNPFSIHKLVLRGLFAAGMAICAWISVPLGDISFTLQSFALFLSLFSLGGKDGSIIFAVYLLMGAAGLPVFSGFQGGFGILLGPSGGYLWGFALAGPVYWLLTYLQGEKAAIPAACAGMLLCYLLGSLWFLFVYADGLAWWMVIGKCVLPFILPDAIKFFLAYRLSRRLHRYI